MDQSFYLILSVSIYPSYKPVNINNPWSRFMPFFCLRDEDPSQPPETTGQWANLCLWGPVPRADEQTHTHNCRPVCPTVSVHRWLVLKHVLYDPRYFNKSPFYAYCFLSQTCSHLLQLLVYPGTTCNYILLHIVINKGSLKWSVLHCGLLSFD